MLKKTLLLIGSMVLLFTGCAQNEPQAPKTEVKKETTTIKMKTDVKKAPKREVQKRVYAKKKLKYRDTSESSKVRLYDPETKSIVKVEEEEEKVPTSAGGKLFFDKGCNMCHKVKESRLGPSVRKLARGYKNKKSELIAYLQRKGEPIIHPDRSSIMRTQLAKLTILSEKQYNDISHYILNGGKN